MYSLFRDLAIIILSAKFFGLVARKCKAPQVVGEIIAGLLIGPCLLGLVQPSDFLTQMAELGVVLLMFSAGLDSDIDEIIKSGPIALLVAMCGVLLPLAAGTALYIVFYGFDGLGSDSFYHALFMGCILTATSVSITVQALRELGHLKTRVGTTILSAAKVHVSSLNARSTADGFALISLAVDVSDSQQLQAVMRRLEQISGVMRVTRPAG